MSIATEITRISGLRDKIRTKLNTLGIISNDSASLDACATAINGLSKVTPATPSGKTITVTPTISNPTTAGVVTVSGSNSLSVSPTSAKGYTDGTTTANSIKASVSGSKTISPTLAAKTYTPGTSNQTIAAGRWLTGAQTIKGDANLVAGNILTGKTVFGVAGSMVSSLSIYETTITLPVNGSIVNKPINLSFPLNGITPYYVAGNRSNNTKRTWFVSQGPAVNNEMKIYCVFYFAVLSNQLNNISDLVTATIANDVMTIPYPTLVAEEGNTMTIYIVGTK